MPDQIDGAIYIRYSPTAKIKTDTLEIQQQMCLELCKQPGNNYKPTFFCSDSRAGGGEWDRPGLWEALEAVPRNGVLIARDRSRIARDPTLMGVLEMKLAAKGAFIHTVHEGRTDTSLEAELLGKMLDIVNWYMRKQLGRTCKAASNQKMKNLTIVGGKPPFGYKRTKEDTSKCEIDPEEMPRLQRMLQLRFEGASYAEVTKQMIAEGHEPPRTAKEWDRGNVMRMIKREIRLGRFSDPNSSKNGHGSASPLPKPDHPSLEGLFQLPTPPSS